MRLEAKTARLAHGFPVVCLFVNDDADREVLAELAQYGTRVIALRCAGYNNVDLAAAKGWDSRWCGCLPTPRGRCRTCGGPDDDPQPPHP